MKHLQQALRNGRTQRGVTLIETGVVTTVVAVLTSIAAPSFDASIQRRHLEGASAQLETDIHHTRMMAVARNAPLRISFQSGSGGSCYVIHTGAANACGCDANGASRLPGPGGGRTCGVLRPRRIVVAAVEFALGAVRPATRHQFAHRHDAPDQPQRQRHPPGGEHHGPRAFVFAGARAQRLPRLLNAMPSNRPAADAGRQAVARTAVIARTRHDNPQRMPNPLLRHAAHRRRGFTLIELMIVIGVIGVLAAVALPSFLDSVRKGRRADAINSLAQVQQAQERWRANNASYSSLLSNVPANLTSSGVTPAGYYGVSIDAADAAGYTLTAQAVTGTSQASDANCSTLRVRMAGGNIQYGGCAGCALTDPLTDPNRCWAR